ncbi:MAG: hypothetical protein WBC78_00440 [Candidatus Sulfotelmatobacter sp.]
MPDARRGRSRFKALLDAVRRLLGKQPPQLPGDPYADQMAPVRRGPKGRSGAAAVAEPEEDSYRAFPPRG